MIKYFDYYYVDILLFTTHYFYNEMNKSNDIIYIFYKNNNKLCNELIERMG